MIEINGLVKTYGLMPVLRGVNLSLAENDFVALVGPNGSGKSTLMRIVATLLKPTAGEVKIGGWLIPQQAERVRQHIGLISHQPMVYGDLSALENLRFYAGLYQVENPEARIKELLHFVGLFRRQNDVVRTFSRGMLQRLAIARATLHNPSVLLLDEPYTGLDQQAVALLNQLLEDQRTLGRTILMITHDFVHGLTLCDEIAILNRGVIAKKIEKNALSTGTFIDLYREIIGS